MLSDVLLGGLRRRAEKVHFPRTDYWLVDSNKICSCFWFVACLVGWLSFEIGFWIIT